ncbi:MAG: hypothetical protein ACW985_08300, partial [Candidatus Thorarchaeota archaeon]
ILGCGITNIILQVIYAPLTSRDMQSPNQSPSVDISFVSLTRTLIDSSVPKHRCPECNAEIDFSEDLEWMGPTAFLCKACKHVIELERIRNL